MKITKILLFIVLIGLFASCTLEDDNQAEQSLFAVPKYQSLTEIRNSISIQSAKNTNSNGKIYVTANHLFYIAQEEGIHIFNNQNPSNPENEIFIKIAGVHDIAIKGNYLYADNYYDLLVFDISDINQINLVQTLENAINFNPIYPSEAAYYDFEAVANEGEVLINFELEYRDKPDDISGIELFDTLAAAGVGISGSYAKFQIKNNALYTLEDWKLNIFNISEPTQTFFEHNQYIGNWFNSGQFETLFIQRDYLFVGATDGLYIVDISDEFNPQFISRFTHGLACDPVVVHQNKAYLTIRSNTQCWGNQIESQINVIDISNINQPKLLSTYLIDEPYGLGYHNNKLYVCNNNQQLNIFDATTANLELQNTYQYNVSDVIALDSHLIAVGNQKIMQFNYQDNYELELISEINF